MTNWKEIAKQIGALQDNGSESGSTRDGQAALEAILGDKWIQDAVEHILSFRSGSEVALSCLRILHSEKAVRYAYQVYKDATGERADRAVFIIKDIAHPVALQWVEEFLNDSNVMARGLGVLDQLLWTEQIPYNEQVEALLQLALANSNNLLADHVSFIKDYLKLESENSR
jgi:hypothetical protein